MDWLEYIAYQIVKFVDGFLNVVSYIRSILQALRYALTTMLSWIYSLIIDIFTSWLF